MPHQLQFDHYRVLTDAQGKPVILGRGGMGITFKATDTVLGRDVALKVILASQLDNEEAQLRFLREAGATARLHHRNIATIYHQGRTAENVYYAMEFIEGETVSALVSKQGPLALTDALDVTRQVVQALSEAEQHGLVHRDIKPANIMLKVEADGQRVVKLIDFGLAKFVMGRREHEELTQTGSYLGTAITSSPEQCRGEELDTRSDIYSLGITLWFMLEGTTPFADENPLHVLLGHLQKPPPLETLTRHPESVRSLLQRMLEKRPEDRPANTAALLRLLDGCLAEIHAPAREDPPTPARLPAITPALDSPTAAFPLPPPAAPRRRARVAAAAALIMIVIAGATLLVRRNASAPDEALTPHTLPAPPAPAPPEVPASPPTAAALAAAANASLAQLDWAEFLAAYNRLHTEFGASAEGATLRADLEQAFRRARTTQRAVLVAWAEHQPAALESVAQNGLTEAFLTLGDTFARADPARAANYYATAAQRFLDTKTVDREFEALVLRHTLAGAPPDPVAERRLHAIVEGFRQGRYASTDTQAAEPWLVRLAQQGALDAMLVLGEHESATQPDVAAGWYWLAAQHYDREKQWGPALETYLLLINTFPSTPEAKVARSRLKGIGDQLLQGEVALEPPALAEIEPLLRQAGDLPIASVLEFLGRYYLEQDPNEAFRLFQAAAEAGSPPAMAQSGLMLQRGVGTTTNPVTARVWFQRAAEAKNTLGSYLLALCLLEGIGGEKDPARAVSLLEDATAQRYAPAMDKLADCYRRGVGVARDFARARELYDAAIGLHHLDSFGNLGVMFMNGEGGPRNETQAFRLFAEGAEQNNPWCLYLHGAALWHGTGVQQDRDQARVQLQRAAEAGLPQARAFLEQQAASPAP